MKKLLLVFLSLIMIFSLASCGDKIKPDDSRVVMTLGDKDIVYDYFRYVFLNAKYDMDNGENDYWDSEEKFTELKNAVLETLIHNRAIELLAKEHGIKLSKSDKKEIKNSIKAMKEADPSYKESMKKVYMSEYTLNYLQTFTVLWGKAYDEITSDESGIIKSDDKTVMADIPINSRCIRYIMVNFTSENKEDKLAEINEALSKAQAGEDFASLVKEYCDDNNMITVRKDGYYYTKGQILEEIENEAEKLEIGQISNVLTLDNSYFIIERCTLNDEYIEENFSDFVTQYKARVFNEMVSELEKSMEKEYSDIWKNLKIEDVK